MNYEPICRWLRTPIRQWPPDHYTLLGLSAGESDVNKIETAVHERLNCVRSYQLSHPDQATEAMNRLAEAYACLTDPQAKSVYDAALGIQTTASSARKTVAEQQRDTQPMPPVPSLDDTVTGGSPTVVHWTEAAPPVREPSQEQAAPIAAPEPQTEPKAEESTAGETSDPAPEPQNAKDAPPAQAKGIDPLLEAAIGSRSARKGIGTLKGLLQRRQQTRELALNWQRLGRYFKQPKRTLTKSREAKDFLGRLARIEHLLEDYPSFLAKPGKPGYRVAMLALDEDPLQTFQNMTFNERTALAKDWITSSAVLMAHLQFLEKELQKRHKEPFPINWMRSALSFLDEHRRWGYMTMILALLAFGAVVFLMLTT